MNQWRCNDTKVWAAAFLSGQMTREEDRRLGGHLRTCESCRKAVAQIHAPHRYVESLSQSATPATRLSADRLALLLDVDSGARNVPRGPAPAVQSAMRAGWSMATAAAVVLCTAIVGGNVGELPGEMTTTATVAETTSGDGADYSPVHDYPTSFGMVYPARFAENGGYVAGSTTDTVPIDFGSINVEDWKLYDPAYGMGRSVVDFEFRAAIELPRYYGVDGPHPDRSADA